MERLHDELSSEELSTPADPAQIEKADRVLQFSVEDALDDVENLEEGYQLANELESSETNAICEFLISNFSADEDAQTFLRAQLREHIAQLVEGFPTDFDSATVRCTVKVQE